MSIDDVAHGSKSDTSQILGLVVKTFNHNPETKIFQEVSIGNFGGSRIWAYPDRHLL